MFFTFDSDITGVALNTKIDNIEKEIGAKIKEIAVAANEEINSIRTQHTRDIKAAEGRLEALSKQLEKQVKASEQECKMKMKKKLKQMSKTWRSSDIVQLFILFVIGVTVSVQWFK